MGGKKSDLLLYLSIRPLLKCGSTNKESGPASDPEQR
jgi:hypothetical protein